MPQIIIVLTNGGKLQFEYPYIALRSYNIEHSQFVQHYLFNYVNSQVIEESNCLIAEGFIMTSTTNSFNEFPKTNEHLALARSDVYRLLFEKGYEFT